MSQITLRTHDLQEGVGYVAPAASQRSANPLQESVHVRMSRDAGLELMATDQDVEVRHRIPTAAADGPGEFSVSAARLHAVVREIEEEESLLEVSDSELRISTGQNAFRLRLDTAPPDYGLVQGGGSVAAEADSVGVPVGESPEISFEVSAPRFLEMIRRTIFATSKDHQRFAMHGVLLRGEGKNLVLVATDGRRLARIEESLEAPLAGSLQAILSPRFLAMAERILSTGIHERVTVTVLERLARLQSGTTEILGRLIDGAYPDVDRVIPKNPPLRLRTSVRTLAAGLQRVTLLTTKESRSVEMQLDPGNLRVRSRALEIGQAQVDVPAEYEGRPLRVGFMPEFFLDALRVMDGNASVEVALQDERTPSTLTDREDFLYVISPIVLE